MSLLLAESFFWADVIFCSIRVKGQSSGKGKRSLETWYAKITGFLPKEDYAEVLWFYLATQLPQTSKDPDPVMMKEALGDVGYIFSSDGQELQFSTIEGGR